MSNRKKKSRLRIGDLVVPSLGGPLSRIDSFVDDCECDEGDVVRETDHVAIEWFARGRYYRRNFVASDLLFAGRRVAD